MCLAVSFIKASPTIASIPVFTIFFFFFLGRVPPKIDKDCPVGIRLVIALIFYYMPKLFRTPLLKVGSKAIIAIAKAKKIAIIPTIAFAAPPT